MQRLLNNVRYFIRYYGVVRLPAFLLGKLVPSVQNKQWFIHWKESAIDRRFGIETLGNVDIEDLDYDGDSLQHAVEYCPSSGIALGVILEELGIDYSNYSFIDFGCGKGRVLCLAAEFPFASVIGVELSVSLCQTAQQNLRRMYSHRKQCSEISCENTDATLFSFPEIPLVLYFFNPFGEVILSQVIRNIEDSWKTVNRDIVVVYSNPVHRQLFDESESWIEHRLQFGETPDSWAVYRFASANQPSERNRSTASSLLERTSQ